MNREQLTLLGRNGGQLNVASMPAALRQTFRDHGISDADLRTIAGPDQVIRGEAELNRLFDRIDRLDTDGSSRSITTTDATGAPTPAGRVFEAVRVELEAARARAAREGGSRFTGNTELENVAAGRATLGLGARGDSVRILQQALLDVGALREDHGVTGTYDAATADAVRRFQRETGLGIDGSVGADTLSALASAAPPPGRQLTRSAEYDRLYADGRLDITMAVGFDEGGSNDQTERGILSGLRAQGYTPIDPSRMTDTERARYGFTAARPFDPNARYFAHTFHDDHSGRDITAVVRLITPGTDGARARASFQRAMEQDEVVMYNGHARYGTGPDFDTMSSGAGNFVVDPHGNRRHDAPPAGLRSALRGRESDLSTLASRPDYQLLIFDGCNTEEYLHNFRDATGTRRSMVDTDIIATQTGPRYMWTGEPAIRFLQGIEGRQSNNVMFADQARMETDYVRRRGYTSDLADAGRTFIDSGFLGNSANRVQATTGP